jgi:hypothetical protein
MRSISRRIASSYAALRIGYSSGSSKKQSIALLGHRHAHLEADVPGNDPLVAQPAEVGVGRDRRVGVGEVVEAQLGDAVGELELPVVRDAHGLPLLDAVDRARTLERRDVRIRVKDAPRLLVDPPDPLVVLPVGQAVDEVAHRPRAGPEDLLRAAQRDAAHKQ